MSRLVFGLAAALVVAGLAPAQAQTLEQTQTDPVETMRADIREACALIAERYIYFAPRQAHWDEACALA